jgi:hypothetical protein
MPVESATDRAAYLADFGDEAIFTHGTTSTAVRGILDAPTRMDDGESGAGSMMVHPSFLCAEADLPAGFTAGDGVSVGGSPYVAKPLQPDGSGMVLVLLERA